MKYAKLKEEPLKSAVQQDFFSEYKYTQLGNVDFVIASYTFDKGIKSPFYDIEDNDNLKSLLWAEAKQGTSHDIFESFVQLILTIGKERTFEKYLPPKYIGAFDAEKFAFIEYHEIQDIFFQNDFNWNVTPSNHDTKEFRQLYDRCKSLLENSSIVFYYEAHEQEFREFIRLNFKTGKEATEKISVTKNNFTFVFLEWSKKVQPTIAVDWAMANKKGIISADFFLADLLSSNEESLKDLLYVVLRKTKYELDRKIDEAGFIDSKEVGFNDEQKAYKLFWSIYARPPKEEYWNYIIGRRDLLVPQDIRECKGAYFTPQIWVEKSQQYLAEVLGENWQDEYYIWDCCAGTGNMEVGLTNKYNVWASTLDQQDVDVMHERIRNGANLLENHVFQFDFLNDPFTKCPQGLQDIINDPEKRKKLVIYINPPYAEATSATTVTGTGSNKAGVATENDMYKKYKSLIGKASNELFAQFFIRIYEEIPSATLAEFSTLKILQASNFQDFRNVFQAKLERVFVVPAKTFDNVDGSFPIGFFIWNTSKKEKFSSIIAEAYNANGSFFKLKKIQVDDNNSKSLNKWIKSKNEKNGQFLGLLDTAPPDYQNNKFVNIAQDQGARNVRNPLSINEHNLIKTVIYLSVRHCYKATWHNDRDQFLYPNDGWQADAEFQSNCLIYTLFHGQNRITSKLGTNHWIPFSEAEVDAKERFESHFMSDFLAGKIAPEKPKKDLFSDASVGANDYLPLQFTPQALAVMDAGRELWRYYHAQSNANPNASFYDIKEHFQRRSASGRMNSSSDDAHYTQLLANLKRALKALGEQIKPKVYEYGFLK